jgi:site-specific recombinase XerC
MEIEDALDRYLVQLRADGRSQHTVQQYARHIGLLARWARDVRPRAARVEDIDHEAVAAFLVSPAATSRAGNGKAKLATSANCLRSSIRGFFRYLHDAGHLREDPSRLVRRALTSTPPPKGLTAHEEGGLLDVLRAGIGFDAERDCALFNLMLRSGLRVGSVVDLKIEDLDLERGVLHFRGKGGRRDHAFISPDTVAHLRAFIASRTSGPLFAGRDGTALTTRHVARRLRGWAKRAGIARRVSPHQLRHALAQKLYAQTGDVLLVREVLRHRNIASTMVYVRIDEERVRRALG